LIDILPNCSNPAIPAQGLPCTTLDWQTALKTTNAAGGGFPIPIPDAVRNAYQPTCSGTFAHSAAQCTSNPGIVTPTFIDFNYKSPYMIQYNASVEQQLPWNMALGVAYVGNHGIHLPMVRDGNPILPTSFGPCGNPASVCVAGSVPFWDTGCVGTPLPAGCSSPYQNVNPNYGSDINVGTFATSRYNALQVNVEKRTSHGLQFDAAYTHSRVTDETQGQSNIQDCIVSGGLLGVYPLDPTVDKGPACFNIPNNWEFNVLYHLPSPKGSGFMPKALGGWFMSSIVSIQSGQPFSPISNANRSNSGVAQAQQGDRVNINTPALLAAYPCTSLPGKPAANPALDTNPCAYQPIVYNPNTVITGDPNQWFNPAMFSLPPVTPSPAAEQASCAPGTAPCNFIGQLGTAGRNILSGPPERNWDFSIVKQTKLGFLGEGGMLEFRAEFFNILNHTNFSGDGLRTNVFNGGTGATGPFSEAPKATAGLVQKQLADNQRQIQFALRLEF
jgi:hypothetical protein